MIGTTPKYFNSTYFDIDTWSLKPGAPKEIVDEFEKDMKETKKWEKDFYSNKKSK